MKSKFLLRNHHFSEKIKKIILNEKDFNIKLSLLNFYASFVVDTPTGCYFQAEIENELLILANDYNFIKSNVKSEKSILVMSSAYEHGGHTRIVEHIINNSQENKYDLIFTKAYFDVPESLSKICKIKKCNILFLPENNILNKFLNLRDISKIYQNILLHINPEDFIPILAYGNIDWNIPVFLYNHAEHRTWFGNSIVDVVLDLSTRASKNTKKFRMIENSEVLTIPIAPEMKNININKELRDLHRIPQDGIVLMSAGSEYKYRPTEDIDIRHIVTNILTQIPNSYFIIIGINPESKSWQEIRLLFGNRIILLKALAYYEYKNIYNVADIYIDSMPTSGLTIILEAAARNIPIVYLKSISSFPDSIVNLGIDYVDIIPTIRKLIHNNSRAVVDMSDHLIENFINKHDEILEKYKTHKIVCLNESPEVFYDFDNEGFSSYILKVVYNYQNAIRSKCLRNIPFLYKLRIACYIIFILKDPINALKVASPEFLKKIILNN